MSPCKSQLALPRIFPVTTPERGTGAARHGAQESCWRSSITEMRGEDAGKQHNEQHHAGKKNDEWLPARRLEAAPEPLPRSTVNKSGCATEATTRIGSRTK
jgi:hypothetical protein